MLSGPWGPLDPKADEAPASGELLKPVNGSVRGESSKSRHRRLCRHAPLPGNIPTGIGTLATGVGTPLHLGAAKLLAALCACFADIGADLAGLLMLPGFPPQEVSRRLGDLDTVEHQLDMLLANMRAAHCKAVIDKHILAGVTALPAGCHGLVKCGLLSHGNILSG